MNMKYRFQKFSKNNVLLSIVMIILGILLILWPGKTLEVAAKILSIALLAGGVICCFGWYRDRDVYGGDYTTLAIGILCLVAGIVVIGFLLAMLLNREMKGRSFFRTLYFMPAVLSMITIALVFKQVYFYVLPGIGKAIGSATLSENIIADRKLAIYGILFVHLWQGVALPTLLFLSGLQTIPIDLYEAASIDGANAWHQFKSITVPYILPTLSVVLVLAVKQGLNVFDYINAMTKGGPGGATTSIAMLIWQNAWERNRFSYAIAQAVVTGLIIAVISFIQIKFTNDRKVE